MYFKNLQYTVFAFAFFSFNPEKKKLIVFIMNLKLEVSISVYVQPTLRNQKTPHDILEYKNKIN